MGLTSWAGGALKKSDVGVAKNYIAADEIEALNRIVNAYLEFAELQARGRKPMHMADWISKLDDFLRLADRDILKNAGFPRSAAGRVGAAFNHPRGPARVALVSPPGLAAIGPWEGIALEELDRILREGREAGGSAPAPEMP